MQDNYEEPEPSNPVAINQQLDLERSSPKANDKILQEIKAKITSRGAPEKDKNYVEFDENYVPMDGAQECYVNEGFAGDDDKANDRDYVNTADEFPNGIVPPKSRGERYANVEDNGIDGGRHPGTITNHHKPAGNTRVDPMKNVIDQLKSTQTAPIPAEDVSLEQNYVNETLPGPVTGTDVDDEDDISLPDYENSENWGPVTPEIRFPDHEQQRHVRPPAVLPKPKNSRRRVSDPAKKDPIPYQNTAIGQEPYINTK